MQPVLALAPFVSPVPEVAADPPAPEGTFLAVIDEGTVVEEEAVLWALPPVALLPVAVTVAGPMAVGVPVVDGVEGEGATILTPGEPVGATAADEERVEKPVVGGAEAAPMLWTPDGWAPTDLAASVGRAAEGDWAVQEPTRSVADGAVPADGAVRTDASGKAGPGRREGLGGAPGLGGVRLADVSRFVPAEVLGEGFGPRVEAGGQVEMPVAAETRGLVDLRGPGVEQFAGPETGTTADRAGPVLAGADLDAVDGEPIGTAEVSVESGTIDGEGDAPDVRPAPVGFWERMFSALALPAGEPDDLPVRRADDLPVAGAEELSPPGADAPAAMVADDLPAMGSDDPIRRTHVAGNGPREQGVSVDLKPVPEVTVGAATDDADGTVPVPVDGPPAKQNGRAEAQVAPPPGALAAPPVRHFAPADAEETRAEESLPSLLPPQTSGTSYASPTGPAATQGGQPLHVPQVAAQISAALSRSADGATELALSPDELGHVRLRLEPDAANPDRMVVMITFERPETLDLFRRHAGELAEALRSAGYAGADIGFGQQGAGAQGFDRRADPPSGWTGDLAQPDAPPPPAPRLAAGASLDLRL